MHFRSNIILETSTETRVSFQSSAKTHLDRFRKTSERRKLRKSADAKKTSQTVHLRDEMQSVELESARVASYSTKSCFYSGLCVANPWRLFESRYFGAFFSASSRNVTKHAAQRSDRPLLIIKFARSLMNSVHFVAGILWRASWISYQKGKRNRSETV